MIILEAMCLGKVPVMYDLPYARELTNNGEYGILATSVNDMVTKISHLLQTGDTETLQSKIKKYSRENFTVKKTAQRYQSLYKTICG